MVVLGGGAVSYERGTPVCQNLCSVWCFPGANRAGDRPSSLLSLPSPYAIHPVPESLSLETWTPNSHPQTWIPKLQPHAPYPKPETQNPKPQISTPKPQVRGPSLLDRAVGGWPQPKIPTPQPSTLDSTQQIPSGVFVQFYSRGGIRQNISDTKAFILSQSGLVVTFQLQLCY